MSIDKADYENREQAWVKHWLLEKYLEKLILKVGTRWKRFVYVDAFAGPWGSTSSDLSDTSFSRALSVLKRCQEKMKETGVILPMKAIFLEKKRASAERLIAYAKDKSTNKLEVIAKNTDFLHEITYLEKEINDNDFGFILVDPTGFKDVTTPKTLAPLLQKRGVEILINLMWDHINRFWNLPETEKSLDEIFGSDRDKRSYEHGGPSEQHKCQLYTARLKATSANSGNHLWASAFPILKPRQDRTHYYLVYTTHSPVGLLTFDEVAEDTWQEQTNIRASAKLKERETEGQGNLFGNEVIGLPVERPVYRDKIRNAWLNLIPEINATIVVDARVMANLLEECSCLACDLQESLRELIKNGIVENASAKKVRPKNAVHWQKKESIRRMS